MWGVASCANKMRKQKSPWFEVRTRKFIGVFLNFMLTNMSVNMLTIWSGIFVNFAVPARDHGSVESTVTLDRKDDRSLAAVIPVFAKIKTLPCSQTQPAVADWNRQRTSQKRGFHMRGHIIRSFARVLIRKIFRRNGVERGFKVFRDVGIGVLINRQ